MSLKQVTHILMALALNITHTNTYSPGPAVTMHLHLHKSHSRIQPSYYSDNPAPNTAAMLLIYNLINLNHATFCKLRVQAISQCSILHTSPSQANFADVVQGTDFVHRQWQDKPCLKHTTKGYVKEFYEQIV